MSLFGWFKRRPPRGIHSREAAKQWASTRFPAPQQPVAAYVADLLCEQIGVSLSAIEPTTTFTVDLRMDDLEPVEFIMALEEDPEITIPYRRWRPLEYCRRPRGLFAGAAFSERTRRGGDATIDGV